MSYMESKMQDQIEGSINLQNAICDDACDIFKETGIMPLDMKMQRDELQAQLALMKERIDSLEKDAARYQWLAVQHWVEPEASYRLNLPDTDYSNVYMENLGSAIDAKMASKS